MPRMRFESMVAWCPDALQQHSWWLVTVLWKYFLLQNFQQIFCAVFYNLTVTYLRRLLCRWAHEIVRKLPVLWHYLLLSALAGYICEDRLHSWGGNGEFSFHCGLEGETAEQKRVSFPSTSRFSQETGPWWSCSLHTSSACSYLEGST